MRNVIIAVALAIVVSVSAHAYQDVWTDVNPETGLDEHYLLITDDRAGNKSLGVYRHDSSLHVFLSFLDAKITGTDVLVSFGFDKLPRFELEGNTDGEFVFIPLFYEDAIFLLNLMDESERVWITVVGLQGDRHNVSLDLTEAGFGLYAIGVEL